MARLLTLGVGLLGAVAILGPALAGEAPPPPKKRAVRAAPARVARAPRPQPQPVQQTSNWTGGQVGGSNGGSFANNAFAEPGSYVCAPASFDPGEGSPLIPLAQNCYETPFGFTGHRSSYTIGPFLGYRVQLGAFVIGAETDISYKRANSSASQTTIVPITAISSFNTPYYYQRTDNFSGSLNQGWDGSVRGRLGYLVTPWTLLYATGGMALGKVSGSLAYSGAIYSCDGPGQSCTTPIGNAVSSVSFSETRVGYTVGGGVEYQFSGPWSARVEYRYSDLGSFTKSFAVATSCATCANPSPGASIELHPTFHTVRVGLGFGF
jgi:outer membrane immunogenic protein